MIFHIAPAWVDQSPTFLVADPASSGEVFIRIIDNEIRELFLLMVDFVMRVFSRGDSFHLYAKLKVIIIYAY